LLTGILGSTSGNIFFTPWYKNAVLSKSNTVMEHFKAHGYSTFGSGKLMHHELMEPADGHWDEYYKPTDYGPFAYDKSKYKLVPHPDLPEPFQAFGAIDLNFGRISQVPYGGAKGSGYVYKDRTLMYVNPNNYTDRDLMPDEINAEWAIKKIKTMAAAGISKPFFLGVGFTKPHTPMYCPDNYFEMFPEEDVPLPFAINSDESTPFYDITEKTAKGYKYHKAVVTSYATSEIGLKKFRQAYHACRAFVSDLIDKVVLALKDSPFWKDTVVVVTSDNGWNDGAHKYVAKNAPWQLAAAVPLIIRAPGQLEGTEVLHPTSLVDIYPTLVDLCGLGWDNRKSKEGAMLDGHSLKPFMSGNPDAWTGPEGAASLAYTDDNKIELAGYCKDDATCHHWSVRTLHMRYILYNDGQEEMYNETADKGETNNLAYNDDYAETKAFARVALETSSKIKLDKLGTWKEPKFCQKYCAGNPAAWSSKCGWGACMYCPECAQEEVIVDVPTCKSFCATSGAPWNSKCEMEECQDCEYCLENQFYCDTDGESLVPGFEADEDCI
jgi:iduronate 2-sulfatase